MSTAFCYRALIATVCLAALSGCSREGVRTAAGAAAPAPLAIPINLRCTTCDDFIRCTATGAQAATATARTPSVVYRLKEKTFWAQIATIGDYLTQHLSPKTSDERPMALYRDDGAARSIEYQSEWRARIDAAAAIIVVLDRSIDQRNGVWRNAQGERLGICVAMPRRAGYALVREFLGRPALAAAGN
jgi:hypothetical protein